MKNSLEKNHELFHQFIGFFVVGDNLIVSDDKFGEFIKSFQSLHIKCIKAYCDSFNSYSNEDRHKIYNKMISLNGLRCLNLVTVPSEKSPYSKFCKTGYCTFDIIPVISDLSELVK